MVTHSLSFPFTLLFRSRPFSPSYVTRSFFLFFHFPTLCELLRTRHVFNELQVARSDSFRKSISWPFLFFSFFFNVVGSHGPCGIFILFHLFFFLFFFHLFCLFCLSLLPYYASGRVGTLRSSDGTSAIISLVPACGTSSRSVCSFLPVLPSILSSEVRCVSLRIVMPPHYYN